MTSGTTGTGRIPGAVPLLGHVLPLVREPLSFLASLPNYGDVVRIKLGTRSAYVICTPELTREFLQRDRTFDKGGPTWDAVRDVVGDGVATCPHTPHRRQRRLVQPAFNSARLPGYAKIMSEQTASVVESWQDGDTLDVLSEMHAVTGRILLSALFTGANLRDEDLAEMLRNFRTFQQGIWRLMFMPSVIAKLNVRGNRRYRQAKTGLRHAVESVIAQYRADGTDHGDLLSMLLAAQDPDSAGDSTDAAMFSETELADQCVTFLFGGTETAADALAWSLHFIAGHPQVEARLQAEVDEVLGDNPAAFEHIPRLDLTERVIIEALRLCPPAYMLSRITTREAEIGGHIIPANTPVMYSPYLIHRRPDVYSDPERFDPDRWRDNRQAVRRPNDNLLPFGSAARQCVGNTFALTETTLALATIIRRWRLRHLPGARVRPVLRGTLEPGGLSMRIESRRRPR